MITSRLRRVEEKNASRRIAIALFGTIGLLVFFGIFGIRLLIGFSLLVDRIRGISPSTQQQQSLILPPVLDPLPESTNSTTITVRGTAAPKSELILYVNENEYKKLTVADEGTFEIKDILAEEGSFTVSAKGIDEKNNVSDLSNVITTIVDRTAPKLTVDKPADSITVNDGTHKVSVDGLTDEDMKVTINGRIVVVKSDGSFSYSMPLNDGENILSIVSRDPAGNETKVERKVIYQP
ncbi:MAG: hypothetical protein AAB542_00320 [Patescibacteria group bacterium]